MFAYPAAYASEQFLKGWVPSCASAVAGTTASATAAPATAAGLRNTFTGSPQLCAVSRGGTASETAPQDVRCRREGRACGALCRYGAPATPTGRDRAGGGRPGPGRR